MLLTLPTAKVAIGETVFAAKVRHDLSAASCARLAAFTPYRGSVVHARWSGEAIWSPLAAVWGSKFVLPAERATSTPMPGEILLFGGQESEPELLITYGACRFASRAGPLAGNPVLTIDDRLTELAEIGAKVLWCGAMNLSIQ